MPLSRILTVFAFGLVVSAPVRADITLAGITETQGSGAIAGTAFRNGYQLAIDEINAAGGVLGQRLTMTQFDIDSTPAAAADAAKSAVATKPFAILGPVFSGLTLATMPATQSTGIPHFTGSEAASISRKYHPTIVRTSLSQHGSIPRLAALATYGLAAKRIALLCADNEFGRDARALLTEELTRRGATLAFAGTVQPGQKDVDALVRQVQEAQPDAVVLYLNEGEAATALQALRNQAYRGLIIGEGPLVSAQVLAAAGSAAEGVIAHTGISVELPSPRMRAFVADYTRRFGAKPEHNAVKGYFAVQVIKAGLLRLGKIDAAEFMGLIKNTRLEGRTHPDLMTSVRYDFFGHLNRDSYLVQVRGGATEILATMSSLDTPFVELANGKSWALNSNELRRELAAAMARPAASAAAPPTRTASR